MQYDVIIIGAGQNGLTAAGLLAKKGKKVCVLERSSFIGGLAASREFHPNFKHSGIHIDTSTISSSVVEKLQLKKYGVSYYLKEPGTIVPDKENGGIVVYSTLDKTASSGSGISEEDRKGLEHYHKYLSKVNTSVLAHTLSGSLPNITDTKFRTVIRLIPSLIKLRMLGKKYMMELLRILPMNVADYLGEYIKSSQLIAAVSAPSLYGNLLGPISPGTNFNFVLHNCLAGQRIKGGGSKFIDALETYCRNKAVTIKTDAEVSKVIIEDGEAKGVKLKSGDIIRAKHIHASCDPITFSHKLIEQQHLSQSLKNRMRKYRSKGSTAVVHFALSKPLSFDQGDHGDIEFARIIGDILDFERSYDATKYGQVAQKPTLEVFSPSIGNPELCPQDQAVLTVQFHYCAYDLRGTTPEQAREDVLKRTIARISEFSSSFESSILGNEVLLPIDIESTYGVKGGHIKHGDEAIDQVISRPIPDLFDGECNIKSLSFGGSGSFPGGHLSGIPGEIAAERIS